MVRVCKEVCNLSNTTNVFDTAFFVEPQILVQAVPAVVAVKAVAWHAKVVQSLLERKCNSSFSCPGKAYKMCEGKGKGGGAERETER